MILSSAPRIIEIYLLRIIKSKNFAFQSFSSIDSSTFALKNLTGVLVENGANCPEGVSPIKIKAM